MWTDPHGREWSEDEHAHFLIIVNPATDRPIDEAPVKTVSSAAEGAELAQEFVHEQAELGREVVVWLVSIPEWECVGEFRCRKVTGWN